MKCLPLALKRVLDVLEACPCHRFPFAQGMAMMRAMRIVISDHAAIVALENRMVDISEIIPRDPPVFVHPDFAAQKTVPALARNSHGFIMNFPHRHDILYHACMTLGKS